MKGCGPKSYSVLWATYDPHRARQAMLLQQFVHGGCDEGEVHFLQVELSHERVRGPSRQHQTCGVLCQYECVQARLEVEAWPALYVGADEPCADGVEGHLHRHGARSRAVNLAWGLYDRNGFPLGGIGYC